jgi:uncharacterized protein DUF3592
MIVVYAIGMIAAMIGAWRWRRKKVNARNWAVLMATVENFDVIETDSSYQPNLLYAYKVDGEFYSGEFLLSQKFPDPIKVHEIAGEYLGKQLTVRYRPEHPQESICLESDQPPLPDSSSYEPTVPHPK